MIGIKCEACSRTLLDSGDKCVCGMPYNKFVLRMVEEHQKAKRILFESTKVRSLSKDRLVEEIMALGRATTACARMSEKLDKVRVPAEYIERQLGGLKVRWK